MAGGTTRISDVVVPKIFNPYIQQITQEKSEILRSGIMTIDASLSADMSGAGMTFNTPSFKDLDNDAENIATDDPTEKSTPHKIGTATEIAVRMSRNNSWSSMNLVEDLAGADPQAAIGRRVGEYWARRMQLALLATMGGVIKDNTDNDGGDYQHDVSGDAFEDGVTNFTTKAFLGAGLTMGDSQKSLTAVIVHSVVYNRMQNNNMIDFIPDARGEYNIPVFLGKQVIVDDGMPVTDNKYDTWLFGAGALRLGIGSPHLPTELYREPASGKGSGQDVLHSRVMWAMHPAGHAYVGTPANGGPDNTATENNLNIATSWDRVFSERKMIRFARLVTREA